MRKGSHLLMNWGSLEDRPLMQVWSSIALVTCMPLVYSSWSRPSLPAASLMPYRTLPFNRLSRRILGRETTAPGEMHAAQAIQEFLTSHKGAGGPCRLDRMQAAMLMPGRVIEGGSMACNDNQLFFQSPNYGLIDVVGPPMPRFLQVSAARAFIEEALQHQALSVTTQEGRDEGSCRRQMSVSIRQAAKLVGARQARYLLKHAENERRGRNRQPRGTEAHDGGKHEQPQGCTRAGPRGAGPIDLTSCDSWLIQLLHA